MIIQMTQQQMKRWTHRHCRFAIADRLASLVCQRLEASGIRKIAGLHLLHVILAASEPYTRRLSDEEKFRLLELIITVGDQLRGRSLSVVDLRLRLPWILSKLRIPLTYMKSPEVAELVDEALETLRLKGRDVIKTKKNLETDWHAVRHISDPLRFQPKTVVQKV